MHASTHSHKCGRARSLVCFIHHNGSIYTVCNWIENTFVHGNVSASRQEYNANSCIVLLILIGKPMEMRAILFSIFKLMRLYLICLFLSFTLWRVREVEFWVLVLNILFYDGCILGDNKIYYTLLYNMQFLFNNFEWRWARKNVYANRFLKHPLWFSAYTIFCVCVFFTMRALHKCV